MSNPRSTSSPASAESRNTFARFRNFAREDRRIQELLQEARKICLWGSKPRRNFRRPFSATADCFKHGQSAEAAHAFVAKNPLWFLFHVRGEVEVQRLRHGYDVAERFHKFPGQSPYPLRKLPERRFQHESKPSVVSASRVVVTVNCFVRCHW